MSIPKATFFNHIKEFKLKELFNELGWDNANIKHPVKVDDTIYRLSSIAQKKDFLIFLCTPEDDAGIPDSATRKKIDNAITKLHYEHLIIYVDGNKTRQHWELMIREQNKPVVCRPIDYYAGQQPELLFQKLEGLFFTFEDEEKLSIVDVRSRVMANFEKNAEVVTKKFYERFQKEHHKFLGFIDGIQEKVDQEWYASLMLNRLMFIYFIQKKGVLDKSRDYLRTKLKAVQQKKGMNKFYSFYRDFLLILFHKGLGSPFHDAKFIEEFGKVPYLNGGLFDVHKIEHENKNITIEDKAFECIFEFFDEYNWHLDTHITATGRDINPDVIGYIFEKYINDRAAMGAYYTKEDITEYISKNCIVPWLFDEVKRNYPKPFAPSVTLSEAKSLTIKRDSSIAEFTPLSAGLSQNDKTMNIWTFLKESGDTYIYPAVKHGIKTDPFVWDDYSDLPANIRAGLDPNTPDLVEKRKCWNRPAPSDIALPTEIYREVIARRKCYYEVRQKIGAGEITEINDFITYNLDIRQFAQDVLKETDNPELIKHFYKAVRKITVLDPTCGSGAFLFAALNVLEPLYFACVTRMREFVEDDGKGKHKLFEEQLAIIDLPDHPSTEYFIYKSIILHNLYGVDIMKEAVEIAKLRLFLKLVVTVDVDYSKPNLGLEPLPDIDFNIRSGNTLVGYATLADLDKAEQGELFGNEEKQAILEEADIVSRAYARFKDAQLVIHSNPKTYKDAKDDLNNRLTILNDKLNKYLAVTYFGVAPSAKEYQQWLVSHQPFHWLAEYYTIIMQGGFDVIIGNPPYVEYNSTIQRQYTIQEYKTLECGNLHAYIVERSLTVVSDRGRCGFIVPLPSINTSRMERLQQLIKPNMDKEDRSLWVSAFDERPSNLFSGVDQRLIIEIFGSFGQLSSLATTGINRWASRTREYLFPRLTYAVQTDDCRNLTTSILKIKDAPIENSLLRVLYSNEPISKRRSKTVTKEILAYRTAGGRYWKVVSSRPFDSTTLSGKVAYFNGLKGDAAVALVSSSTFWWYYSCHFDMYNLKDYMIFSFRFSDGQKQNTDGLATLGKKLTESLEQNAEVQQVESKTRGTVESKVYVASRSKPIIDEIDKVLAKHYGFTEEELDFIINYDIKYRMGKELVES